MNDNYTLYYKRRLPHYQPRGQSFFVTFRTSDPIPPYLLSEFRDYQQQLQKQEEERKTDKEFHLANQKKLFAHMDDMFTRIEGKINLTQNPEVAQAIADIIHEYHGQLYHLYVYTIMPNHVHLILKPNIKDGVQESLPQIVRKIKGVSARKVNMLLNRQGPLWNREYYDLWPRTGNELIRMMEYVRQNPVAAGLVGEAVDWPWTWVNMEMEYV